jgi:hypothetical protein
MFAFEVIENLGKPVTVEDSVAVEIDLSLITNNDLQRLLR